MIKTQINIRTYLALTAGCLLLTTVSASARTKLETSTDFQLRITTPGKKSGATRFLRRPAC
jgi:hypothetical protein